MRTYGSPLVVYDEATLRARARAYRAGRAGGVDLLRDEGVPECRPAPDPGRGGDRSRRLDPRRAAVRAAAGIGGADLVVHGNNKADEELGPRAEAGALLVVLDSLEEIERARAAGSTRTLISVTPGIDADTHEAIRTGHHGSKFGLTPEDAFEALRRAPEIEGLHVHIGSQLRELAAARRAVEWLTVVRGTGTGRARLEAQDDRPRRRARRRRRARGDGAPDRRVRLGAARRARPRPRSRTAWSDRT